MDPISLNAVEAQGPSVSLSKKIDATTIKPTGDSINTQNAANEANSYYKYDTMELSREYVGYRMKSDSTTVNSDTEQQSSTVDQKPSRIPRDDEEENRQKKETTSQTANADEPEDEKVSNNQLGGYTSSELKGLVLSGKITVAAYNSEIKSRQDDNQPAEPQQQKKPVLGQSGRKAANSLF
ncbi:hypothetical protein [Acetobacterium sp.]|jgi:hypothetical protein|uniref:hypothetical protein n=1 Tax=Acetobacterium sp. TaxID=1872094 RepID=UPI000CBE5525|nr:hypothetical protein [Acetobacterium sp.]MDO9490970.1 hypothetical protein [Acetobacterium sp.]PKM74682.1 MAG: hypothetical protein CVU92_05210 [Firmicutes bacterium HGW-Firmicutes-17]